MATPLAAALATREGEDQGQRPPTVDWAVDSHSRPALAGNPHVDRLLDASGCIRGDLRPGALLRLLRSIRRERYDAIFVPDRSPLLSWVARLSGVPLRVGLASGWRGFGYTRPVPTSPTYKRHEAEIYLDLARAVGIADPRLRTIFVPGAAERERVARILAAQGIAIGLGDSSPGPNERSSPGRIPSGDAPWVAMHPGGGVNPGMRMVAKRWPAERFAAIADRVIAKRGCRVMLLGGPDDRPLADAVLASISASSRAGVTDLCGKLSLAELAALVERCDLYLGNDSGVAHLAAAVGTPVRVIFGPTDPARYGPLPGAGLALCPPDARSPSARLSSAIGSKVIEQVSLEQVWTAIETALTR